jgi:hypothetical protein
MASSVTPPPTRSVAGNVGVGRFDFEGSVSLVDTDAFESDEARKPSAGSTSLSHCATEEARAGRIRRRFGARVARISPQRGSREGFQALVSRGRVLVPSARDRLRKTRSSGRLTSEIDGLARERAGSETIA